MGESESNLVFPNDGTTSSLFRMSIRLMGKSQTAVATTS